MVAGAHVMSMASVRDVRRPVQEFDVLEIVADAVPPVRPETLDPTGVHAPACNEMAVDSAVVPLVVSGGVNVNDPVMSVQVTPPVASVRVVVVGLALGLAVGLELHAVANAATNPSATTSDNLDAGVVPMACSPWSIGGAVLSHPIPTVAGFSRISKGAMVDQTRLQESPQYTAGREELRLAEIELMRHRERVAALRRQLPPGSVVDDYQFSEGPRRLGDGDSPVRPVRLTELFTSPRRSLVLYHLMYGKAQTSPCPMCTMWIDGLDAVAPHVAQNVDFAVVAAADPVALRAHARARGWNNVRLLSSADSTFKYDLGSEDADGAQESTISVFTLDADGTPRHFYSAHPTMADDINQRGIDLLAPAWHLLDLTPQGRGDWYAQLDYPPHVPGTTAATSKP